jgi:GNAT superfamily N-acetyltransferase
MANSATARACAGGRRAATSPGLAKDAAAQPGTILRSGEAVGMLAYHQDVPVGWCSMAPRESYAALERSAVLPRVDDQPVWSVVCFFLDRHHRGLGLRAKLLAAAIEDARSRGATAIEAYPWPGGASYRYMGTREMYSAVGFADVPRPDGLRPVMRLALQRGRACHRGRQRIISDARLVPDSLERTRDGPDRMEWASLG